MNRELTDNNDGQYFSEKENVVPTSNKNEEEVHLKWGDFPPRQDPDTPETEWKNNLSPTDLVAVHVTNTLPEENEIRTHVGWELRKKTKKRTALRDTVHFTLNGVVAQSVDNVGTKSQWLKRKYAVLAPFHKFKLDQIKSAATYDTFLVGDVALPDGSIVLVDYRQVSQLIASGIISLDELGMSEFSDQYTASSITNDLEIEKEGITYKIVNLGHDPDSFRLRIQNEIERMGYRFVNRTPWSSSLNAPIRKYGIPEVGLHDTSMHGLLEAPGSFDMKNQIEWRLRILSQAGNEFVPEHVIGALDDCMETFNLRIIEARIKNIVETIPRGLGIAINNWILGFQKAIDFLEKWKMENTVAIDNEEVRIKADEFIAQLKIQIEELNKKKNALGENI